MSNVPSWTDDSSTYVTQSGPSDVWASEAARRGGVGTQRVLEVAEVVPPADVAQALKLPEGDVAVMRRRLVLLDDQPVELAESYYPPAVGRGTGLAERRKVPGGVVALLAQLGHHAAQADEDVHARPATDDERRVLDLPTQAWVLVLRRVLSDNAGQPIEVSVMTMRAEGRHLHYRVPVETGRKGRPGV